MKTGLEEKTSVSYSRPVEFDLTEDQTDLKPSDQNVYSVSCPQGFRGSVATISTQDESIYKARQDIPLNSSLIEDSDEELGPDATIDWKKLTIYNQGNEISDSSTYITPNFLHNRENQIQSENNKTKVIYNPPRAPKLKPQVPTNLVLDSIEPLPPLSQPFDDNSALNQPFLSSSENTLCSSNNILKASTLFDKISLIGKTFKR